jgi:hypothetical protein
MVFLYVPLLCRPNGDRGDHPQGIAQIIKRRNMEKKVFKVTLDEANEQWLNTEQEILSGAMRTGIPPEAQNEIIARMKEFYDYFHQSMNTITVETSLPVEPKDEKLVDDVLSSLKLQAGTFINDMMIDRLKLEIALAKAMHP